jgi:hypothetical protein
MAESTATEKNTEGTKGGRKPITGRREFASDGMRLTAERLIENVTVQFKEFLERASYLDLYLLWDVLDQHSGISGHLYQDDATLGQAFMDALGLPGSDSEEEPEGDIERSAGDNEPAAEEEVPAWVEKTPDECRYTLVMFDSAGDAAQEIDMGRSEFEILKGHLAACRRHSPAND